MKKLIFAFAAAVLCLSANAQVGVADPGIFGTPAPVGPTPVEQWLMNEGSGTVLHTSSSSGDDINANTGNGFLWASVAGFPGLVPTFNGLPGASGVSGTGTNQTNTNFTGTTPFSVSVWALINSFGSENGGTFISTFQGGSLVGWEVAVNGDTASGGGLFNMDLINSASGNNIQVAANTAPSFGVIHHFVATYDGSQKAAGITLYIDGVAQAVTIGSDSLTGSIVNTQPVGIGERVTNSTVPLDGAMADLRIYNVQLTSSQVSAIFAAGPQ
jgi:hypothetical protein